MGRACHALATDDKFNNPATAGQARDEVKELVFGLSIQVVSRHAAVQKPLL